MVTQLLEWVNSLDVTTLYELLGVVSFIESIFPPAPADVVVAIGAFYSARREAVYVFVLGAIVAGSLIGSLMVYAVARRYGADWMHRRLEKLHLLNAEERLEGLYKHYGLAALFVSRFVPGLRMVVSPMAGALRINVLRYAIVIIVASSIWYGLIISIAFRVGEDWEQVQASLHEVGLRVGFIAIGVLVVLGFGGWLLWRRHRQKHPHRNHTPPA